MPIISVITVCFNTATSIRACLESVSSQSVDLEHIIIDGKSTDKTMAIIDEYRTDPRLRVVSEPDKGIYDAMNKGIGLARGQIIGFLNADDRYASPNTLSNVVDALADPTKDSCYGDLIYVSQNNPQHIVRYWRSGLYNQRGFYFGWMPPHPTFYAKRAVYEQYGSFNTALGSAADYEIMLRFLCKNGVSTTYIPEVLVAMQTGGVSNRSLKNRIKANRMDRMAWQVNGLKPLPLTLVAKPLRKLGQFFSVRPRGANGDYRYP